MVMDKDRWGDGQPWGEYAKIWIKDRTETEAFPEAVGENNIFLSTYSGTCIKDYINTGSTNLRGVDLGCNYGGMAYHFLNAGIEYIGVDQSEAALDIARNKFPNLKFINSFLWDIHFKEEFDIVLIQAVLQHNLHSEQERIIPRVFEMLKPGGVLNFTESTVLPRDYAPPMNSRTNQGWIDLMEKHGFKYVKSWYYNAEKIPNIYLVTKPLRS
jgi:SAM-dependent methyltransferase